MAQVAILSSPIPTIRAVRVSIPTHGLVREVVVDFPDVGTTTEADAALVLAGMQDVSVLAILAFAQMADNFGAAQSLPEDLDSAGRAKDGSIGNAMKHAYWAAATAFFYGEAVASFITTAHEYDGWIRGNSATSTVMDLRNNAIGISVGVGVRADVDAGKLDVLEASARITAELIDLRQAGRFWVFAHSQAPYLQFNNGKPITFQFP